MGGEEGALVTALNNFATCWQRMTGYIEGSEVLMVFVAGSLLILGFKVFKKGRKAVR